MTIAFDTRLDAVDALTLVGKSLAIRTLRRALPVLGPLDAHVVITGEPGTGRATTARLLHQAAGNDPRPFFPVSLAGLGESQIAARLFGANGVARLAMQKPNATVYLEPVEMVPLPLQERLVDLLRDGNAPGVRLLAASRRSLEQEVRLGRFSRRLFDRIATLQLILPPLRARTEDIDPIAMHVLQRWNVGHPKTPRHFGSDTIAALERYAWPGNVRELVELIERSCANTRARTITAERIRIVLGRRPRRVVDPDVLPLRTIECDYLRSVLARCGGNQSFAAKRLGISRSKLARRLRDCERLDLRAAE